MMVVVPVAIATLLVSSDAGISSLLTGQPAWLYLLPFVLRGDLWRCVRFEKHQHNQHHEDVHGLGRRDFAALHP